MMRLLPGSLLGRFGWPVSPLHRHWVHERTECLDEGPCKPDFNVVPFRPPCQTTSASSVIAPSRGHKHGIPPAFIVAS